MLIEKLHLRHFSAFQDAQLTFVPGINVFLGANATGKSHALKVMYAQTKVFEQNGTTVPLDARLQEKLARTFLPEDAELGHLLHRGGRADKAVVSLETDQGKAGFSLTAAGKLALQKGRLSPPVSALFLPTRDLLAMYTGFAQAYQHRELAVDETHYDTCVALGAAPLRAGRLGEMTDVARRIERAIGGKVTLKGDRFYVEIHGSPMEANLIGEGVRKVAGLLQLLQNGSLQRGSVLFWDEPEAGLNPRLATVVAELLVDLTAHGVQVFAATHDFLLAHKLSLLSEYKKRPDVPIRFFAFHRTDGVGPAIVSAADTIAGLPDDPILEEFLKHQDFERDLFDEEGARARG